MSRYKDVFPKRDKNVVVVVRENKFKDGLFLEFCENDESDFPRGIWSVELMPKEVYTLIRNLRAQLKENRQKEAQK